MAHWASSDILRIRQFENEKGTGAEMRSAIVSGVVTGDAQVSYWPILFP